jgi:hypothetical protein
MMRKPCVPLAKGYLGGSQKTTLYNDIYNMKVVDHLVQCPHKNLKMSGHTMCHVLTGNGPSAERQNNLKCILMADA